MAVAHRLVKLRPTRVTLAAGNAPKDIPAGSIHKTILAGPLAVVCTFLGGKQQPLDRQWVATNPQGGRGKAAGGRWKGESVFSPRSQAPLGNQLKGQWYVPRYVRLAGGLARRLAATADYQSVLRRWARPRPGSVLGGATVSPTPRSAAGRRGSPAQTARGSGGWCSRRSCAPSRLGARPAGVADGPVGQGRDCWESRGNG